MSTSIELVRVVNEDATAAAFATAIDVNLRRSSSIDDAIVEMLRPRCSLLLLDNCEHLVEPVAGLVARILREAPTVSVLATSREPLAVPGEQVWSVAPLPTASDSDSTGAVTEIPAVELFAARARAADPDFALDDRTAPIVVEICRRLDGIPLAIELAAARVRSLGVAEIASRLDERFGLLKAMRRGSDPRHRAMHDAISWSYELLEPDEQELFVALSVFAGSFDLDAARAVCPGGDVLDLLTRLTERSMLTVRPQAGGATRYELLETLRDYGRTRLGDDAGRPTVLHARRPLRGRGHRHRAAAADHRRGGTRWSAPSRRSPTCGPRIASRSRPGAFDDAFAVVELHPRVRDAGHALRGLRLGRRHRPRARHAMTIRSSRSSPASGPTAHGSAVSSTPPSPWPTSPASSRPPSAHRPAGWPERTLANVLYILDEHAAGNVETARQLALAEASGNESRLVHACYFRAVGLSSQGFSDEAAGLVDRAHELARRTRCPTDLASAEVARGFASRVEADALDAFVTADQIARSAGNRWMSAFAATEAAGLLVARGDVDAGLRRARRDGRALVPRR